MTSIISVINQKGGVGKTTTAHALSVQLAKKYRVLLVDADQQANLSFACGIDEKEASSGNLYTLFLAEIQSKPLDLENCIYNVMPNLCILPSSIELATLEMQLTSAMRREFILAEILESVCNHYDYDYIIIDSPPSLGIVNINVLATSEYVLIPVNIGIFSLVGINLLMDSILRVRKRINPKLKIAGILLTMVSSNTKIFTFVKNTLHKQFNGKIKIFDSIIPSGVKTAEASLYHMDITSYAPKGKVAEAYGEFSKEFIRTIESEGK
ncbi:chromosome partitioning protein [Clostridiales Family XIII bacterium PM5-7]